MNAQDMVAKGRDYRGIVLYGEAHATAKLSNVAVEYIKISFQNGTETRRQLANRFSVTYQHIDHIVKGRLRINA